MDNVTVRRTKASPAQVFSVLSDGWLFVSWVVGATRMRQVDDTWPAKGARLHHSVGVWPFVLDDITEVVDVEPGRRLRLRAHARPLGRAEVELLVEPDRGGSRITMRECPGGVTGRISAPVTVPLLGPRNRESLRRLAMVAENRPV